MAQKRGLGRGLASLIPTETIESNTEKTARRSTVKKVAEHNTAYISDTPAREIIKEVEQTLKITELEPNSNQPRKHFEEDPLQELSDSIKEFGVIQPIVVTPKDGYYEIIAGERRWRAARMAGLKEVPVIIRDYTEQEIVEISLIENIQRENLNPIEEAQAYQRLIQEFSLKQDEVAERVSKSRTTITNSMRLLKLCEPVQQMVIEDKLSSGHARALLALNDTTNQYELACKVFDESLSVRETEALVRKWNQIPKEKKESDTLDYKFLYSDMETCLKEILGSKVMIKPKNNEKGKIEIEYYSSEELDRLVDKLKEIQK